MSKLKKVVCVFAVVAFCILPSMANALELTVAPTYNLYDEGEMMSALGLKAIFGGEKFHVFTSVEELLRKYGGQECVDVMLWGAGAGVHRELFDDMLVSLDVGWYVPRSRTRPPFQDDGAWYAFSNALGISIGDPRYYFWEHYSYDVDSGLGGGLGIAFKHAFSKRFSMFVGIGYRYLKLREAVYGWNGEYNENDPHWEMFHDTNFSGAQLTVISFSYDFR